MLDLSPVARRRFERFKQNRRGWWSLWLFIGLFILTLGGELIANDKPLVLSFKNELYFPVFKRYTEQQFGGQLPFQADYRSDYVQKLIKQEGGWMLFPPIPFSDDTPNYDLTRPAPSPPSAVNWLGTDDQSRDVLARVIFGARVSILFALALTAISATDRHCRRGLAGLLRRLGGLVRPTRAGSVVRPAGAVLADYPVGVCRAEFLVVAGDHGAVFLAGPGGRGARRVPARAQPGIREGGACIGLGWRQDHSPAYPAQRHDCHPELFAVHSDRRDLHVDAPWIFSASACLQAARHWAS